MRRAECWPRSKLGGCRPLILLFKVGFSGFARHHHRSSCGGEGSRGGSWAAAGTCAEGDGDSRAAGLVARRWVVFRQPFPFRCCEGIERSPKGLSVAPAVRRLMGFTRCLAAALGQERSEVSVVPL